MRKKVRLIFLCGIMLLSVCGCGNNFESEIVGNNFVRKIESSDTAYGKIITSHTLIFEEDNKVCDILIYHRKIYIIKE